MHIIFIKDYDVYEQGMEYVVERTLGARFCRMGVAIPIAQHLDMLAEKAAAEKKEKAKKAAVKPSGIKPKIKHRLKSKKRRI